MKLPSGYPFPLHLSTAGQSKNRLHPLVKFQPVRVVNFLPTPTCFLAFTVAGVVGTL
jgi:hypothetical protein